MQKKYAIVIHLKTDLDIMSGLLFDTRREAASWCKDNRGARGVYGFSIINIRIRK